MANGQLGAYDLAATTNTTLYNPSGKTGGVTVSLCNRNATSVTVRLAIASTATPSAAEWVEYGATIFANNVLERTGLVVGSGQYLVAWASGTGVSAIVMGYED